MEVNRLRTAETLHWIRALNNGYAQPIGGEQQVATLSNIAYYMLDGGVRNAYYEERNGYMALRNGPSQETFDHMKNHMANTIHRMKNPHLHENTVRKRPGNTAAIREGLESKEQKTTVYSLTSEGESYAEHRVGIAKEVAEEHGHRDDLKMDVMFYPVNTRVGWEVEKLETPKLKAEMIYPETGELLRQP